MTDTDETGEIMAPDLIGVVRSLRGFAPDVRPPRLPAGDVSYALADTPVGRLVLAIGEAGLVASSYDSPEEVTERLARRISPRVLRSPRRLDPARRQLDEFFDGRRREFDLPVDLTLATPFGRRVLAVLGDVGYGTTTTYASVAAALGAPTASRAVGGALGANPLCVVLPCHRVIKADGGLGGYAGGVPAKTDLLALERRSAQAPAPTLG